MRDLWRTALWGLAAAAALSLAAYASTTNTGGERLMLAASQMHEIVRPTGIKPPRPLDAREGQRLAESVRVLSSDRDRLLARIAALEHSLQDVTGSIARVSKAVEAAAERPAPVAVQADPPADDTTASVNAAGLPPPRRPQHPQAVPDAPGKTEFGLDIGGAGTLDGLRTLWAAARQRHAAALDGLRPIVHLRETRRPGGLDLRLVAGPLPNAAAAARLCATLTAAGAACHPTVFDGQRLAAR
jgi:hypothetical protein